MDENNAQDATQPLDDASILTRQGILMLPVTDEVIQALTRFWNAHTVEDLGSLLEAWEQDGDATLLVRFNPRTCRVDIVREQLDVNDPPPPPGTGAYL